MRLSKQRIVLLGVLGAGVAFLAADRTVLGPAGAAASTPPGTPGGDAASNEPASAATGADRAALRPKAASLADRLEAAAAGMGGGVAGSGPELWAEGGGLATVLAVGPGWALPIPEPAAVIEHEAAAAPVAPPATDPASVFRTRHRLTAIASGAGSGPAVAVIDGHPRPVGAVIEGFVLTAIGRESVVLERGEVRVEMSVRRNGKGNSDHGHKSATGAP